MQYIFPILKGTTIDHCRECGGEEYQGDCGELSQYLVVTLQNDGSILTYGERAVCEFCAKTIKKMQKKNLRDKYKRGFAEGYERGFAEGNEDGYHKGYDRRSDEVEGCLA